MDLLEKTRSIYKSFQNDWSSQKMEFNGFAQTLSDLIVANVYVMDTGKKLIGSAKTLEMEKDSIQSYIVDDSVSTEFANQVLEMNQTRLNLRFEDANQTESKVKNLFPQSLTTIIPILSKRNDLGRLIISRSPMPLIEEEVLLVEYGAMVIGMAMLVDQLGKVEEESRNREVIQLAIGSLSFSELEAARQIIHALEGMEGLLVASKVADRRGITRSVIVNALRKLESAGVVASRSLGMKGTHIKILNPQIVPAIEKACS